MPFRKEKTFISVAMGIAMAVKTTLAHPGNLCCGKEGCATKELGWFLPDPVMTKWARPHWIGMGNRDTGMPRLGQETSVAGTVIRLGGGALPSQGEGHFTWVRGDGWVHWDGGQYCDNVARATCTPGSQEVPWKTPLTVLIHQISPVWTTGFLQRTLRAFWEITFLCQSCLFYYLMFDEMAINCIL